MNIKSILLGSAAALVAVSGAKAADMAVAEPVEYVKVCDAQGAGFFYIPGTETCLRVSGYVRVDYNYSQPSTRANNITSTFARGRVYFDARTETEYGLLRSFIGLNGQVASGAAFGSNVSHAFIQFGGWTFGYAQSNYDYEYGYTYGGGVGSDAVVNQLAYTYDAGNGVSATIALEDASFRWARPAGNAGGHAMPDVIANINVSQGWGSAQLMGAVRQNRMGGVVPVNTKYGYAIGAGVTFNLPMIGEGDRLYITGAWTKGAKSFAGPLARGTDFDVAGNQLDAWSVGGGIRHFWAANLKTSLDAGYSKWDSTNTVAGKTWKVAGNIVYTPVDNLDFGLEAAYTNTKIGNGANSGAWSGRIRIQRSF